MSSLTDSSELTRPSLISSGWTTAGTARTRFAKESTDDTLKVQIAAPVLTESLQRLRQQFSQIQLGSEYFFQALDYLCSGESVQKKETEAATLRLHVQLSGLLLMRKAVISGSTCLPWSELQFQIKAILLQTGFFEKEISPDEWRKWLLTSSGTEEGSEGFCAEKSIFVENNSLLYFKKNLSREFQLISLLQMRLNMQPEFPEKSEVENVLKTVLEVNPVRLGEHPLKLAEEQKDAVLSAISNPFLIISGGPGTGKTSVAVTLLRVLKRLGLAKRPALAAPTGRAAKRMSEAVVSSLRSLENLEQLEEDLELLDVASEAKTLHRLLEYYPVDRSFRYHEYAPLEHDLLIIDEGSMIDQDLMISLLRAAFSKLQYQSSVPRIILLGDTQQLPSIGNGAVLQELTAENSDSVPQVAVDNPVPVVRLVHSFRQKISDPAGRNILGVASTVKEMEINPRPELLFETESPNHEIIRRLNGLEEAESEKVMFLNQPNSPNQLLEFAQWWVKRFLLDEKFMFLVQREYLLDAVESDASQLDYLFNYLKRFRILTATQVLSTGAEALNQIILKCWLAENGTKHLFSEHYPGEPVMVSENNYQHKLFNGDQGIFLKFIHPVTKKVELKAVFPVEEEHKTFYVHELHHLHPAYATSVHKSQGSEYDHLALILPAFTTVGVNSESEKRTQRELMSREMLYTALTRAKKSVLIMGDQRVLESAAMHKVLRYSGLGAALRGKKNLKVKE